MFPQLDYKFVEGKDHDLYFFKIKSWLSNLLAM